MARHLFGLSPADVTVSQSGTSLVLEPGATGTAWDARTGGTQLTDLTDLLGNPTTTVTSDTYSVIGFYGPDGVTTLYMDFGFAGGRVLMQATDLGSSITSLSADVAGLQAGKLDTTGGTLTGDLTLSGATTDLTVGGTTTLSGVTTFGSRLISPSTYNVGMLAPSRTTPSWRPASISHIFQSGHGWTASGAASSNLNNTAAFVRGTQCASITTDTAGGSANLKKFAMSAMDLTDKMIRVICRVDNMANLSSLNFFVGTSSLANNFKWRLNPITATSQIGSNNEWITITFGWASLNAASGSYSISSAGVPSTKTGFTDLEIQAIGTAGNAVTLDVNAVEIVDGTTTTFPNGVISIVFDDGADSIYNYARPAMDTYGYRGTNYVIVGNLGAGSYMTTVQNRSLQDHSGWEIGLHSYSGTVHNNRYTSYAAADVDDDIRWGKEWLVGNGFRGESIAWPGGEYQATTDGVGIDKIAERYFSTGRTILFQSGYATETFSPGMPMRMRAVSSISETQTGANKPANMIATGGLLDKCQLNGGWLILVFHKITTGTATVSTECSQSDFQSIMAAISSRGIPVLPISDVMRNFN
ncbi:polysaccharide deacetylase family protein [Streptomyces sp. CA-106131]|uniref:polysaccharide deacetylase family protein n=1 Tax=Streptomyces sp. CA-106131 TaxID=3240045 RepID=UPI003D89C069